MLRETAKNPRATSQAPQASVSMLNVKVHESTIRERLNKNGLFGRVAGKNNIALVCLVASEQTTRLLEQCPLDRRDQSGDVWS